MRCSWSSIERCGSVVGQRGERAAAVAPGVDGAPADALDELEDLVAGLVAHDLAEQPPEQADVLAERGVLAVVAARGDVGRTRRAHVAARTATTGSASDASRCGTSAAPSCPTVSRGRRPGTRRRAPRWPSTSVGPALWVAIARWVAPRSRQRSACVRQRSGSPPAYCAWAWMAKPSIERPAASRAGADRGEHARADVSFGRAEREPAVAEAGAALERGRAPSRRTRSGSARVGRGLIPARSMVWNSPSNVERRPRSTAGASARPARPGGGRGS